jgi:cobaltochelatase CobS
MQAGVEAYDPARDFTGGLDAYLDALASARVLIMLTGPAGMGKSYWAKSLADRLGLDFGSLPMTEGATPSWILGAQRLNGFGESKFLQVWRDGGVFLLDEMDAADPNMLLVANDALANDVLHNPVNGESYERHQDTILVAATNTLGTGADASYTGRNQLDFSTLDRWRMGRTFETDLMYA